ncbi:MAG: fumarylacetoacetate hydrolase family protein [Sphingomonadaceae bacterium]
MMADVSTLNDIAYELYAALQGRTTMPPIRERGSYDIDDAYRISLEFLRLREQAGERVIGKKIGVTSKAVQDMLGVFQPDFGFLTDKMQVEDGQTLEIAAGLIQPRAEAEIAFILKQDLVGPGVTNKQVLDATESVCACFEIVDSRIDNWNIRIVDTVADNASCGVFVLGKDRVSPKELDLPNLHCTVWKNDALLSEGKGSAVQGSPLAAVAWLANTLGEYGVPLKAGEIILSGSLVPLEPAAPGDTFRMDIPGLGQASISFA